MRFDCAHLWSAARYDLAFGTCHQMPFVESQDDPGQADRMLSTMGERIRHFHQDVNNARVSSKGKTTTYTGFGYEALVALPS